MQYSKARDSLYPIFSSSVLYHIYLFYFYSLDINECLNSNGGCQHNCTNAVGSYYCTCADTAGYSLNDDGHTCAGKQIMYL